MNDKGMEFPEKQDEKKPYILLKYAEQKYLVPMGDTPAGNACRVINALKDFQKLADQDKEHLDKVVSGKEELRSLVQSPGASIQTGWRCAKRRFAGFVSRSPCAQNSGPLRISTECACSGVLWPVFVPCHLVLSGISR